MCLNEKTIGDDRPESTQRGNEAELSEFFTQVEIKFDPAKMFLSMDDSEIPLDWQFNRPDHDQSYEHEKETHYSSFP